MHNTEANKDVVRNFYAAISSRRFEEAGSFCSDDFMFYFQVDTPHQGAAGFIASEKKNFDAFRNFTFEVIDLVAEGDKVVAYMIFEGDEQIGPVVGVPSTGRPLRLSLCMYITMRDGLLVEKRAHFDQLDIAHQFGARLTWD